MTRQELVEGLQILNGKRVPFILSYDGSCGDRNYGEPLPDALAHRILLNVGRSSQATLNGRDDQTVESLYVSHFLAENGQLATHMSLEDFAKQPNLFA